MKRASLVTTLAAILLAAALPAGAAADSTAFDRLSAQYEAIRQALLADSTDGVADAAKLIEQEVEVLSPEPTAAAAGTREGSEAELREILASIEAVAARLASAGSLAEAREGFGKLSEAMVRFRRLVPDPAPVVVFCSMAQKVWLQPKGEIGNPYYGQSMASCGEVVSE